MKEYYDVIADEEELEWFFDHIVEPLKDGESYMACFSARAKKLTADEKVKFGAKRAEMFHTEIGKKHMNENYTYEDFYALVSKFETNKRAYLTASKMPYPDKSLVLYLYMNPCSEAAVAQDTLNRINVINKDLIDSALKGSHVGVQDSIWKLSTIQSHIKSCHAQNPSRRVWIDFDIDCKDLNDSAIQTIKGTTLNFFPKGSFAMVRTAGGVHVAVKKDRLKFNPNNYTSAIENVLKDYTVDEVKKNDNCMFSIPGTWMYGTHITRVLNKEDFC